jgi:hypothetical protein
MKACSLVIVLVAIALVVAAAPSGPEELAPPETLMEYQEDANYAELLNAAQFTTEQLDALLAAQTDLKATSLLAPDEAAALAEVRQGILRGLTSGEALTGLGERAPLFRQVNARMAELRQTQSKALMGLLTEDQKSSLAWAATWGRAVTTFVDSVRQLRGVPDAQWQQMKPQLVQSLTRMSNQIDPAAKATAEQVGALFDAARAMDDQTFKARRAALPKEWAQVVMPNILQRLADPASRDEQLAGVINQLLDYRRGEEVVRAKQDALAER